MIGDDFAALKVLLVEDQSESRAFLRDMLGELGITQVFEAGDGNIGLQFVKNSDDMIDLVLCDWNMPLMSGIDFLKKMREAGSEIPFMMITGRGDHSSVITAKDSGVDGYIRKPFTPEQIEAKLRIVLQKTKAA